MASVKVAIRVRPFNTREVDMDARLIVEMEGKKTRLWKPKALGSGNREALLKNPDNFFEFTFDHSYWSFNERDSHFVDQEMVYEDLGTDVVDCAFEGYNACVFAYGQTGSGKTHTMMGGSDSALGLIPRICKSLFGRMKLGQESGTGYKTHVSYLEIYNERVKDLLNNSSNGHGLRVREHKITGPYVEDLSQHPVKDYDTIQECIFKGNLHRTTASTNMNDKSSRSHAIFTITFVQAGFHDNMPSETVSKIHLVDLAGSERADSTGATGQRLKEGAHINKSLVTLGSVISALAEQTHPSVSQKKIFYIPYRDSVLTWLLKDSLGGNSKTIMIAAISPADCNYGETLSTLRYANRAKNIINKPTINEDPNVKLIRELREEIIKLRCLLGSGGELSLKFLEDLQKKEAQEKVLTEEWTEKWRQAQSILREEKSLGLRKSGYGVVLDSEMPHLIGIHDDISTGVTLYSLKEGETSIGIDNEKDIILTGDDDVLSDHCSIVLKDGLATIIPKNQAQCWLNARLIEEPTRICQGDILLLGRTNMFRYNNPTEAAQLRKDMSRSRLDLSRLSLIAASRENLHGSGFLTEEESVNSSTLALKRDLRHYALMENIALKENSGENQKVLESIEAALKQLQIERSQMYEQYKQKVVKLAKELEDLEAQKRDRLTILHCKEKELMARREMLVWEKSNEQNQIDIFVKQKTALRSELDSRKLNFSEYVAQEIEDLIDSGRLSQSEQSKIEAAGPDADSKANLLMEMCSTMDDNSRQRIKENLRRNREDIEKLDKSLRDKESSLAESGRKVVHLDEEIAEVDRQRDEIVLQRTREEMEAINQKKKQMTLELRCTTDSKPEEGVGGEGHEQSRKTITDTTGSYHTANSNCSLMMSHSLTNYLPADENSDDGEWANGQGAGDEVVMPERRSTAAIGDKLQVKMTNVMFDSGVDLISSDGTGKHPLQSAKIKFQHSSNSSQSSSREEIEIGSSAKDPKIFQLMNKIASQKALIMKNLEMGCDKAILDKQISDLQIMQREMVLLEGQNGGGVEEVIFKENDENSEEEKISSVSTRVMTEINGRNMHNISQLSGPNSPIQEPFNPENALTIPNFIMRGAGKQTHYEYEVKIVMFDDRWTLLRRYSRFRELHMQMKATYGDKVKMLPFPKKNIFGSKSENVAKFRRQQLEIYLKRLLTVVTKIPQCPLFETANRTSLTKQNLIEFSPFFKKGLFECGKHGTG